MALFRVLLKRNFARIHLVLMLVCTLAFNPCDAWGWSAEAHKAIALIAVDQLQGTHTATRMQVLLGKLTLDQIATCPDEVREMQAKQIKKLDVYCARVFPKLPTANTEPWHFVNTPVVSGATDTTATAVTAACAGNCAITQIAAVEKTLQAPTTAANKLAQLQALSYLVHFVGDIHQPLHAAERDGDLGGNKEVVSYFGADTDDQNHPTKLHAIWDNQIVFKVDGTDTELAKDLQPEIAQAALEPQSQPIDWAVQSFGYATTVAYNGIGPANGTQDAATLGQAYQDAAAPVVRLQIARAGVRLAAALKTCLP